jgi:transketolase
MSPLEIKLDSRRGHMGSAMSLIEILRVVYDDIANINYKNFKNKNRDRVILSKGHGCLALYAILADKNFFKKSHLDNASKYNSILGGHPEHDKVDGVEASTGSLGHGLPIGVGIALAGKLQRKKYKTFVIVGDGEINEGSVWEAALSASKHKLNNLKVIVDYNKIQSYGPTKEVLNLEPLREKWKSFGFEVSEINGHSVKELKKNLMKFKLNKASKPSVTICHTIKGKGFPFAENNPFWHHKNNFSEDEIKNLKKYLI